MKRLHRKMTPPLLNHLKAQETRIKSCGLDAYLNYYHPLQIETGSFYSSRFKL